MTTGSFIKIIQEAQSGNRKSFQDLYDEYFGKLCTTAYRLVRDRDAAYDIASDVILKLLEYKRDIALVKNHIAYIVTMVKNQSRDYLAKRNRELSVAEIWHREEKASTDMLWLEDIFQVLTEEEKEIFILYYVWDFSLKKVALQMKITYGAVKAKKLKIKQKLKIVYRKR